MEFLTIPDRVFMKRYRISLARERYTAAQRNRAPNYDLINEIWARAWVEKLIADVTEAAQLIRRINSLINERGSYVHEIAAATLGSTFKPLSLTGQIKVVEAKKVA